MYVHMLRLSCMILRILVRSLFFCDTTCCRGLLLYSVFALFFFFKQKTAYEMRISDWSSDVCSSDLPKRRIAQDCRKIFQSRTKVGKAAAARGMPRLTKIGRASCRERVCQYV